MSNTSKRRILLLAAATTAGLAGAGVAWFQHHPKSTQTADAEIWRLEVPTPSGPMLKLGDFQGKPLILNFWATWCPPCVEELPLLSKFHLTHQDRWNVVALAADQTASVLKFLHRTPLNMPIAVMGLEGTTLSRQLGNERGGLPFTVVFDRHGNVAQRKIGQLTASDLEQWLKDIH